MNFRPSGTLSYVVFQKTDINVIIVLCIMSNFFDIHAVLVFFLSTKIYFITLPHLKMTRKYSLSST